MAELQTVLRDFGVQHWGRKPELINRTLELIDKECNDSHTISAATQKIIEVYNQRKNVEEVVPKTPKKASPKTTNRLIDSSFDDESNDDSSDAEETQTNGKQKKTELRKGYTKGAAIQTTLAFAVLAVVAYALINDKIKFEIYCQVIHK